MTRRRDEELQRAFDQAMAEMRQVPAHLCMRCQRQKPLRSIDAVFGDLQTEKETGQLQVQGISKIRLCDDCFALLEAMHASTGTPMRLL